MKGVRFYLEHKDKRNKRKGRHCGNVVAINTEVDPYCSGGVWCREGLAAVFTYPNSGVATTGIAIDYLRDTCKRISEAEARRIHPALFEHMEA